MQFKEYLLREGDVNLSPHRQIWKANLDEGSRVVLKRDEEFFLKQSMSTPCLNVVKKAEGCYLYDNNGKKYLDFHGNSLHQVGYKNPYVQKAIIKQMESLPFIPRRYTSDIVVEAAEKLISQTKSKDFKVLFTPSGSAAVGISLKMARKITGLHKVISMWESFHGAGLDTISVCNKYGIVLIFDEIPTGLGRSGKFFVHQHFCIEPDILVLGKGLGGGIIPQAAVLVKTPFDIAKDISLGHYSHEKPALGCAALEATIRYIDDYDLLSNCRKQAIYVEKRAKNLMNYLDVIGDFRQLGLLITFELVKDRTTKEKANEMADKVLYHCLKAGLSFKLANGNCITWHPPLIVTQEQLEFAFKVLEKAIRQAQE